MGPGLGLWWSLLWGWGQPAARVTGLSLGQAQTEPQVWRSCWLPRVATARRGCRFWGWHGLPQFPAFNEVVRDQARGYRQGGHTGEGSRPGAALHPERCEVQPFFPARKCKPCFGSQGVGAPPPRCPQLLPDGELSICEVRPGLRAWPLLDASEVCQPLRLFLLFSLCFSKASFPRGTYLKMEPRHSCAHGH